MHTYIQYGWQIPCDLYIMSFIQLPGYSRPPSYQAYLPPGARKTGDLPINSIAAALRDTANLNHQNIRTKSSFYTTIPWRYWNYAYSNIEAAKSMVGCKLHPNWTFPYWPNAPFQLWKYIFHILQLKEAILYYPVCPFGKWAAWPIYVKDKLLLGYEQEPSTLDVVSFLVKKNAFLTK